MSTTPNSVAADGECLLLWAQVGTWDGDALVVLPADTVEYWLARMPVLECRTWGQLRATVTPEVYREVLGLAGHGELAEYLQHLAITGTAPLPGVVQEATRQYAAVPDEPPGDDQPFEATDDLPACADGDWPPSPMYLMNQELPGEVLKEFAETYSTNFNGDFSTIPWDQADNALARLTELGFPLREDPRVGDLIRE
jgi:hypothetical protein